MLRGQIYFYLSLLDKQKKPFNIQQIDPNLLGLESINWLELKSMKDWQALDYIKKSFLSNFLQILRENKLYFALNFWQALSSPKIQNLDELEREAKTKFTNSLVSWIKDGQILNQLTNFFKEEVFLDNTEDLFLLYGLKFLFYLSKRLEITPTNQNFLLQQKVNNLNSLEKTKILVLCRSELVPLFLYLNCEYLLTDLFDLENQQSKNSLSNKINQALNQNPNLKAVLLVDINLSSEQIDKLKSKVNNTVNFYQIDLLENYQNSFFQKIAYQTLGLKLQ